ncbi:hypothetical protein K438DRAFT_1853137 [Mycena galopus ATCC 62051]|nr:hypothetical protein K438DRAFT_1853137 [Mycena galopus ATCC 62051]
MSVWNFTIEDTSPFLDYIPYADGSNSALTNGWIPWYQTPGFLLKNGDPGVGESYHITSRTNASVAFEFYGSAVYLYGTANSSYGITLDGAVSTHTPPEASASDLLFSNTGLTVGNHSVMLSATPANSAQQLAFDRAVISTPFVNNATPTEAFYDNLDTTRLTYTGVWSTPSAAGIPNTSVMHPWHETNASASVSMQIGRGAISVALRGMANWGNWLYSVSLDGTTNTYNGSTFWQVPDALLFYEGGLDPNSNHTISLSNTSPGMNLALNSVRVYTVEVADSVSSMSPTVTSPNASNSSANTPSTSKHPSVDVGAIVGSIVAGTILLAFVSALLWWRFRRRKAAVEREMTQIERYTQAVPRPLERRSKVPAVSVGHQDPEATSPSRPSAGPSSASNLLARRSPREKQRTVTSTAASPTTTSPTAASPTTISPTTPFPTPTGLASLDVDRLIELIAQRIDPARRNDSNSSAPPEYCG